MHHLSPRHIEEHKTRWRFVYYKNVSEKIWKNVLRTDESYLYIKYCNKNTSTYNHQRGEKNLKTWFKESKECFSKGFMIVAGFACNGKLKVKKAEKNDQKKINFIYC